MVRTTEAYIGAGNTLYDTEQKAKDSFIKAELFKLTQNYTSSYPASASYLIEIILRNKQQVIDLLKENS